MSSDRNASMPDPTFETGNSYTPFETCSLKKRERFYTKDFAYHIQNSKPRALGFAMRESPLGMLAWMADKLFTWSDAYSWSSIELITWTLLHYYPGPTTGFQIYQENGTLEETNASNFVKIPAGVSAFAKEVEMVLKSWAETRIMLLFFWKEHEQGGHFAAHEKPQGFVADLIEFFHSV